MSNESNIPVQKVWKPELYKIQLEAPTPKALYRLSNTIKRSNNNLNGVEEDTEETVPPYYGQEYHGRMGHLEAERILEKKSDGTYLLRRSPSARDYYTLSLRFNQRTKHYKIYYRNGEGHFLLEDCKHFDSVHDLVADGLVNFHMQIHAAPIIQQICLQTDTCYQQSPYMTLNRRKLRALSYELKQQQKLSSNNDTNTQQKQNQNFNNSTEMETSNGNKISENHCANENDTVNLINLNNSASQEFTYEKAHAFKVHSFKGLNWCEVCANFLWGFTAQGVKCEDCGLISHTKCSELVPATCLPDLKRIRGVFGTDLTTVVQLYHCSIPFVVLRCVEEVEARGMLQEGIYRVSGFTDEIEALKLALDRDGDKADLSEQEYSNINVIAGTLKLYLRLLPVPLITFQTYPSFMAAASKYLNCKIQLLNVV